MPFRECSAVEERISMLREWDTGAFTVSEVAARYAVARETFYFWKRRRDSGCERWFEEASRVRDKRYRDKGWERVFIEYKDLL